MDKAKKTLKIALFVSLASLVKFDFLVDGFIVAMSVLVMAIFIYCYEELSVIYISFCSAIFSPLFRLITIGVSTHDYLTATTYAIPDIAFFMAYGILYTLIYKYIIRADKNIKNFPFVIFFCDLGGNIVEILARSLVQGSFLVSPEIIGALIVVGICRVILVQIILLAMERYSSLLIDQEHDREYRKLLEQASLFEGEMHLMEKNASEIEGIMVKAYSLYKEIKESDLKGSIRDKSLEIAKDAHEVKGIYLNIIDTMKEGIREDITDSRMTFQDIVMIEKTNIQSIIKKRKYKIDIVTSFRTNFYVESYFKMLSIIRNIFLNSVEAIGEKGGTITLKLKEEEKSYIITIHDNGPGIPENELDDIFIDGYSSKFNMETGNIQRGMGLSIVKDYIENYYSGKISVTSRENVFTKFEIVFPKDIFDNADMQQGG